MAEQEWYNALSSLTSGNTPPQILKESGEIPASKRKHIQSLTQAAQQTIQNQQGGDDNPTAYLGVFICFLSDSINKSEEDVICVCYILSAILPFVSGGVLVAKLDDLSAIFSSLLSNNLGNYTLVLPLLLCFEKLLSAQPLQVWQKSNSVIQAFKLLLSITLTLSPASAAHKKTCEVVGSVVRSVRKALDEEKERRNKFANLPLHKTIQSSIENAVSVAWKKYSESEDRSVEDVERIVSLLNETLPYLPGTTIAKTSEQLVDILVNPNSPILKNNSVYMKTFGAYDRLFSAHRRHHIWSLGARKPEDRELSVDVPTPFAQNFIQAILNGQQTFPNQIIGEKIKALSSAFLSYHLLDPEGSRQKTGLVFTAIFEVLGMDSLRFWKEVVVERLGLMLASVVDERSVNEAKGSVSSLSPLRAIFQTMDRGFTFQYRPSFIPVLTLYSHLFLILGSSSYHLIPDVLKRLCDHQESQFEASEREGELSTMGHNNITGTLLSTPYSANLHSAIGAAVRGMGLANFLEVLPLELPTHASQDIEQFSGKRTWLIPILRENIMPGTPLSVFAEKLLPSAEVLQQKAEELEEIINGGMVDETEEKRLRMMHKRYNAVAVQLWGLFPCFCECPPDVFATFKKVAKKLGASLKEENEIRLTVCSSLSTLISRFLSISSPPTPYTLPSPWSFTPHTPSPSPPPPHTKEIEKRCTRFTPKTVTPKDADAALEVIRKFLGNFVPLLFNAIGGASPHHATLLHTLLRAFLSVGGKKSVEKSYGTVMEKLKKSDGEKDEVRTKQVLLGLVIDFVPYIHQDINLIASLLSTIRPLLLQSKELSLQKKGYKVLYAICTHAGEFVAAKTKEQLQPVITDQFSACSSSSKCVRLRCLDAIVKTLNKKYKEGKGKKFSVMVAMKDLIEATVSEVVMCVKETNTKCRSTSVEVLRTFSVNYPPNLTNFAFGGFGAEKQEEEKTNKKDDGLVTLFSVGSDDYEKSIDAFFKLVIGSLAGKTFTMISSALTALTFLLKQHRSVVSLDVCTTLLSASVTLLGLESNEIRKSALVLMRICLGRLSGEEIMPVLGEVMEAIFGTDEVKSMPPPQTGTETEGEMDDFSDDEFDLEEMGAPSYAYPSSSSSAPVPTAPSTVKYYNSNSIILIRFILVKLVKKCGVEEVEKRTPHAHKRLIINVRKRLAREEKKNKEKAERGAKKGGAKKERRGGEGELRFGSGFEMDDSDDSDDEEEEGDAKMGGKEEKEERKRSRKRGGMVIREGADGLDLLDMQQTSEYVKSKGDGGMRVKRKREEEKFEFTSDGKLILDMEEDNYKIGGEREGAKRVRKEEGEGEGEMQNPVIPPPPSKKRRKYDGRPQHSGQEYRAKKAEGDVKVKGKADPYALIAPDGRMLNKRFRKKEAKQFDYLMNKKGKKRK